MKVARHIEYALTTEQQIAVTSWLMGKSSYRELGKRLGMSHQGAVNTVANVCRQWLREGRLKFDGMEWDGES